MLFWSAQASATISNSGVISEEYLIFLEEDRRFKPQGLGKFTKYALASISPLFLGAGQGEQRRTERRQIMHFIFMWCTRGHCCRKGASSSSTTIGPGNNMMRTNRNQQLVNKMCLYMAWDRRCLTDGIKTAYETHLSKLSMPTNELD